MTHEEAVKQFLATYADARCQQAQRQTEEYYHKHKDSLVAEMAQALIEFFRHIKTRQAAGTKQNISYIFCSFLYSSFMQGKPIWRLDAYDENHYLDEKECTGYFDTPWLFKELGEACRELDIERKTYVGKINPAYIDIIKRKQAYYYIVYPTLVIRQALKEVVQSEEFADLQKSKTLEVRLGEYRDITEVVYSHIDCKQDSTKIKAWLEKKLDDKYFCTCLADLDLSHGDYSECNLSYARLTGSILKNADFKEALLYGTELSRCHIETSDFSESSLSGACFDGATIRGTKFWRCMGSEMALYDDSEENALTNLFSGASFRNGLLEEVDFRYATFDQADFTGATLTNVSFVNGSFAGACFSNAILIDCDFTGADLGEASFAQATLTRCQFAYAVLDQTQFSKGMDSNIFTEEQRQEIIRS